MGKAARSDGAAARGEPVLSQERSGSAPVSAACVSAAVDRGWGSGSGGVRAGGAGCGPRRCGGWGALVLVGAEGVEVVLQTLLALLTDVGVGEVGENALPGGAGFAFRVHQGCR